MAASDEALHALAQHLVGETDGEPPDVQLGPNGLYLVRGTGPEPSVVGDPSAGEPPVANLGVAQAFLPKPTAPESLPDTRSFLEKAGAYLSKGQLESDLRAGYLTYGPRAVGQGLGELKDVADESIDNWQRPTLKTLLPALTHTLGGAALMAAPVTAPELAAEAVAHPLLAAGGWLGAEVLARDGTVAGTTLGLDPETSQQLGDLMSYVPLGAMALPGGAGKVREVAAAAKAARLAEEGLAAERAAAAAHALATMSDSITPEVATAIETAFPTLNKFNKRRGFLDPAKAITILDNAPDIPAPIKQAGKDWLSNVTTDIHPEEIANTLQGEPYEAGRTVQGGRQGVEVNRWPGAPAGVTPKLMQQRRPGLIKRVMDGYLGRDWYETSGKSIFFHTGDDKSLADKFGGNLATLSNDNTVGGNTTMSVKLHDQIMADVNPLRGGKYPTRQSPQVGAIYDGKVYEDWLKKGPFRQQLALGGGYATVDSARAVNDIWMGEFWGFVNPDGTPKRSGFTPAQHKWMDEQTDKLIELMNTQKVGGHDDWNTGNIQAAAWTAAKIRAGQINPADAAKDFASYMSSHYLQTGRDFVPGGKSGHLPQLKDLPADERDDYLRRAAQIFHDPQGRDIAGKQAGQLTGGSVAGPAIFFDDKGVKTEVPGRQNLTAVGADFPDKGGREVARPSMQLVQANEGQYGLLTGQDAIAGTYGAADAPASLQNMADLRLKEGTISTKSPIWNDMRVRNLIAREKVVPQPFQGGVRLLWVGDEDPETIRAWRQFAGLLDDTYGTGDIAKTQNKGFYITNPWDKPEGEAGQVYARLIKGTHLGVNPVPPSTYDVPRVGERLVQNFDKSAPDQARQLIDLDEQASKHFGIPVSQILQDLRRAIRDNGFAGVAAAAKKAGVPLAVMWPFAQYLVRSGEVPGASAPPDTGRTH